MEQFSVKVCHTLEMFSFRFLRCKAVNVYVLLLDSNDAPFTWTQFGHCAFSVAAPSDTRLATKLWKKCRGVFAAIITRLATKLRKKCRGVFAAIITRLATKLWKKCRGVFAAIMTRHATKLRKKCRRVFAAIITRLATKLWKKCRGVFAAIITRLANLSFTEGIFPSWFKLAQVTSLLKKQS